MLLLAFALLAADTTRLQGPVYSGRQGQLDVHAPRIEADIVVDGKLDEAVWAQAAELRDFSQYYPSDGEPARDSTLVYIWYSPTAIHFGIKAYDAFGPHATLADRDKTGGDDHVQLLLGTFNDGRRALTFDVNPFGVQADGVLAETGGTNANASNDREDPDLNPDFVWQSKGHITPWGYEVEIRIPFKSIRYQSAGVQTWGINIVRTVQRLGYEYSWAPAKKANPTFLGQSGHLIDLTDMHRGLVLDLNPVVTETVAGAPSTTNPGAWHYDAGKPQLGGNVRWGITNNLTLNATIRPDFSQVESDQAQVTFDPRNALYFPERRPFFLEGSELFVVPNNLIYTRRIVAPVEAVKVTGQALGGTIGFLSAVDDKSTSATGFNNPIFNILRIQRDVGGSSRIGLTYTDKEDGSLYNRVASLDTRIIFGGKYSFVAQLAGSSTLADSGTKTSGALFDARIARVGRNLSTLYEFRGLSTDFQSQSGFISRTGVVRISADHRYSFFGKPGGLIDAFTPGIYMDGTWQYDAFVHGGQWQDRKLHLNSLTRFRGGWEFTGNVYIERFGFDTLLYSSYYVPKPNATGGVDTVKYTGASLPNLDISLRLVTPQFKGFSGDVSYTFGKDENFYEWSSASFTIINASLVFRPTDQLRATFTYVHQAYYRKTDGTRVHLERIPRLKVEYQLARPLFFRLIAQYIYEDTDALRDDSRTNLPILILANGIYSPAVAARSRTLQVNALLSYVPTPGTVIYAGYGSLLGAADALTQRSLYRQADNFFLKFSYLFRL